jgi:hypothetical protein
VAGEWRLTPTQPEQSNAIAQLYAMHLFNNPIELSAGFVLQLPTGDDVFFRLGYHLNIIKHRQNPKVGIKYIGVVRQDE